MKADRRTAPSKESPKVVAAPEGFFQQYGTRLLLGLIVALLVYILVRNHLASKEQKAREAAEGLGTAIYSLNELKAMPFNSLSGEMAKTRKDRVKDIDEAIQTTLDNSEDPKIRAGAFVVRGDLNWWLATFPATSDTQSEAAPGKSNDKYLQEATAAYDEVLKSPLDQDHPSVVAARLSLAKISENKSQWERANQYYDQVINDASADKAQQDYARLQKENLKKISAPIYTGTVETMPFTSATEPTTEPSPNLAPSTTQPASSQPIVVQPSTTQPASSEPSVLPR